MEVKCIEMAVGDVRYQLVVMMGIEVQLGRC